MNETEKPAWVHALERKHNLPFHLIPGTVYVLCLNPADVLVSVSNDYPVEVDTELQCWRTAVPVSHYVGWTQQTNPINRVRQHYPPGRVVGGPDRPVWYTAGTPADEYAMKQESDCPLCGESLRASLRTDRDEAVTPPAHRA